MRQKRLPKRGPSGTSYSSRRLCTSMVPTTLTYTAVETGNFLFLINARPFTENLSCIEHAQLWHSLIHTVWIYFASYRPFTLEERHARRGDREGLSISSHDQICTIRNVLHNFLNPRNVLFFRLRQQLESRVPSSSCEHDLYTEAWECWTSDLPTQGASGLPLQAFRD